MAFSTTDQRIGVGIIGLSAKGGWAVAAHVPALRAVEGYELRALSSSSAESAGQAHDVSLTFGTAEELVGRDEVDLVVITVKVPHHHNLVTTALQAGQMVLCEWPLGNGLARPRSWPRWRVRKVSARWSGCKRVRRPAVRYLRSVTSSVSRAAKTSATDSATSRRATNASACTEA